MCVFSPCRETRQQDHGESARQGSRGEAEAQAGFRFRKRSGHGKSLWGLFGAAGHSPNQGALATRKVCQNDEFLDTFAPLTSLRPGHICPKPKSMAIALISLAFLAVEPWIAEFPLIWRTHPYRGQRRNASR